MCGVAIKKPLSGGWPNKGLGCGWLCHSPKKSLTVAMEMRWMLL